MPILFADFGEAMELPPENVSDEVDQLIQMVEDSEISDWKRPSQLRKAAMLKKLNVVKEQVLDGRFSDAYDKILHDIKPKLTGLKSDENEAPWATRGLKQPWVISFELNEAFRVQCNIILYLLTVT